MNKNKIYIKLINLISIILLFYILKDENIYPYILSLSIYNIFSSCFNNINIKDLLSKYQNKSDRISIIKSTILIVSITSLIFTIFGIIISDISSIILKINNLFPIFIILGITLTLNNISSVLLDSFLILKNKSHNKEKIIYISTILENILLLLIPLISLNLFSKTLNLSLLYLSKIIPSILIILIIYINSSKKKIKQHNIINKKTMLIEIKKILTNNKYKSIINIVQNSYYYISIILLYIILNTRYNYNQKEIVKIISFIYFYGLYIIDFINILIPDIINKLNSNSNVKTTIYNYIKLTLPILIINLFTSNLICHVIFNDITLSVYYIMIILLSIFITLNQILIDLNKKEKLVIYTMLSSIVLKLIITIPLINAIYRTGYNIIFGDILSTILSLTISIIANYIFLSKKIKENNLDRILKLIYDNLILSIILTILMYIIPNTKRNYIQSLGLLIVYLIIAIMYFIYIKKNKK